MPSSAACVFSSRTVVGAILLFPNPAVHAVLAAHVPVKLDVCLVIFIDRHNMLRVHVCVSVCARVRMLCARYTPDGTAMVR
jgi:hypothetical protein